eukprot:363622-Chlamydomonas_euryale.AAC.5
MSAVARSCIMRCHDLARGPAVVLGGLSSKRNRTCHQTNEFKRPLNRRESSQATPDTGLAVHVFIGPKQPCGLNHRVRLNLLQKLASQATCSCKPSPLLAWRVGGNTSVIIPSDKEDTSQRNLLRSLLCRGGPCVQEALEAPLQVLQPADLRLHGRLHGHELPRGRVLRRGQRVELVHDLVQSNAACAARGHGGALMRGCLGGAVRGGVAPRPAGHLRRKIAECERPVDGLGVEQPRGIDGPDDLTGERQPSTSESPACVPCAAKLPSPASSAALPSRSCAFRHPFHIASHGYTSMLYSEKPSLHSHTTTVNQMNMKQKPKTKTYSTRPTSAAAHVTGTRLRHRARAMVMRACAATARLGRNLKLLSNTYTYALM